MNADNEKLIEDARAFVDRDNGLNWQGRIRELADALETEHHRAEQLTVDLDARWEHSDHTAAKYYRQMREAETARARAMARIEELSEHLGIPYVYETGNGPVRSAVTPPIYLAADLWDALGAPIADFDAYYERNRWADTWANLLGVVRDRVKPKCGQGVEGEKCVLTAGHLPPHYGSSDVGRSEPVPVPEPQGEQSDAQALEDFLGKLAGDGAYTLDFSSAASLHGHIVHLLKRDIAALRAAGVGGEGR